MTRPTLRLAASAFTVSAALLLSACGGGGSGDSDKIQVQGQSGSPTLSPSVPATTTAPSSLTVRRPVITLPPDVHHVFEGVATGDPVKDAVLADNAQGIKAVDAAIVAGNPGAPAIGFYYEGDAAAAMDEWVRAFLDHGITITGTVRYFNRKVTFLPGGKVSLVYCGDESEAFNKDRTTGKVTRTPVTKNSYVVYNTLLRKNRHGVWQTVELISQRGAAQCQP